MNLSERVKKCFPIWQEQAKAGNGIAKYNLAMCYIDSEGVERYRWAITYFIEDEEK